MKFNDVQCQKISNRKNSKDAPIISRHRRKGTSIPIMEYTGSEVYQIV